MKPNSSEGYSEVRFLLLRSGSDDERLQELPLWFRQTLDASGSHLFSPFWSSESRWEVTWLRCKRVMDRLLTKNLQRTLLLKGVKKILYLEIKLWVFLPLHGTEPPQFNTLALHFHQVHTAPVLWATRQYHPRLQRWSITCQSMSIENLKNIGHLRHATSQVRIDMTMQQECLRITC